jgi:hypothetical protein
MGPVKRKSTDAARPKDTAFFPDTKVDPAATLKKTSEVAAVGAARRC